MPKSSIGIFGAQGRFGQHLLYRIKETTFPSFTVLYTTDRDHNIEIASYIDLAILVVKPPDIAPLLKEISPHLSSNCTILSFTAGYSTRSLRRFCNKPVARAMADPWWNLCGVIFEEDFPKEHYGFIHGLAGTTTTFDTNDELDTFTIHLSHLFVILLQFDINHDSIASMHLDYLSRQLHVPVSTLQSYRPDNNHQYHFRTILTRGGISEYIKTILHNTPTIPPDELHRKTKMLLQTF